MLKGKDIDNPATNGKLSARANLPHLFVSRRVQLSQKRVTLESIGGGEFQFQLGQRNGGGEWFIQTCSRYDNDLLPLCRRQLFENAQPFGSDLRVANRALDRDGFRFRKEKCVREPVAQLVVKYLLVSNVLTDDPYALFDATGDQRGKKRFRRLNDVLERDIFARLYPCELCLLY